MDLAAVYDTIHRNAIKNVRRDLGAELQRLP